MFISYIIPPLVGAAIGYITNDIAIRMLFRPHEAKYLFGKRLPFTPGIIPKERGRIALAVGEAISDNLMKTRTITAEILAKHTGKSTDEILAKTKSDSYFTAEEAVDFGLADEIITKL